MSDGKVNPIPVQPTAPVAGPKGVNLGATMQYQDQMNEYNKQVDTGAWKSLNQQQHDYLTTAYRNYPGIFKNPALVTGLLNNTGPMTGVTLPEATKALKFMALYNNATSPYYNNQNPTGFTGQVWNGVKGWWKGMTNPTNWKSAGSDVVKIGEHMYDSGHEFFKNGIHQYGVGGFLTHEASVFGESAANALPALAKATGSMVERIGKSAIESTGVMGAKGYEDLYHTVANLAENVNPWSQKNAYFMAAHVMAYYESMIKKHGLVYAAGNVAPSIAAILAGNLAGAAAGVTGAAEVGAAADSVGMAADLADAAATGGEAGTAAARAESAANAAASSSTKAGNAFKFIENLTSKVNPIGPAYRALKAVNRTAGSVRMNTFYQLVQAQAKNDNPDLWNKTENGTVILANGQKADLGQETLQFFEGPGKGGAFFGFTSGLVDIYAKFIGTDPVGALGTKISEARTLGLAPRLANRMVQVNDAIRHASENGTRFGKMLEQGLGKNTLGNMSVFLRGVGVQTGDDLRALANRPFVDRALRFMADNNASAIRTMFRAGNNTATFSEHTINKLAEATTRGEVLNILSDLADGASLAITEAPTMGMYSWMKELAVNKLMSKQELLPSDYSAMKEYANAYKHGPDLMVKDPSYIAQVDAGLRARTSWRLWLASKIVKQPLYFSKTLKAFEGKIIVLEDANESIPAIIDLAIAARIPRELAYSMGDYLTQALEYGGIQEFTNAYRNVVYHMVMRNAVGGLRRTEYDLIAKSIEDYCHEQVYWLTGLDGSSTETLYSARGSSSGDFDTGVDFNGNKSKHAITKSQTADLRIPMPRDLDRLAYHINEQIIRMTREIGNIHDANLSEKAVKEVAQEMKLTIEGSSKFRNIIQPYREAIFQSKNEERLIHLEGYRQGTKDVENALREASSIEGPAHEQYARAHQYISQLRNNYDKKLADARESYEVQGVLEDNPHTKAIIENYNRVTDREIQHLEGQLLAVHDQLMSMNIMMTRDVMKKEELKNWAQLRSGIEGRQTDKKIVQEFADRLAKQRESVTGLRSNWQYLIDGMNKTLSAVFVPLALLSGRWAMHVGVSEATLNALRLGGFNMFDARLAQSIVKHEKETTVFMEKLKEQGDLKSIFKDIGKNVFAQEYKSAIQDTRTMLSHNRILIRNVTAGVLTGIEKSMIKGWDEEKLGRLVSDTATLIMAHGGQHYANPMGVHHSSDVILDPFTTMNGDLSDAYRITPTGKMIKTKATPTMKHVPMDPQHLGYPKVLTQQVARLAEDTPSAAAAQVIKSLSNQNFGLERWTEEWHRKLLTEVSKVIHREHVLKMSPEELQQLKSTSTVLNDTTYSAWSPEMRQLATRIGPTGLVPTREVTGPAEGIIARTGESTAGMTMQQAFEDAALKDHATRIAANVLNTVTKKDGAKWGLHDNLLNMIINNNVPSEKEMASLVKRMGGTAPKGIPGKDFVDMSWRKLSSLPNLISRVAELGHEKVLGPIVNYMVRDPLFALEYHNQMELGRELVKARVLNDINVESWASEQAMQRMIRFVHNPKDKAWFEHNMRVLSPFYFAQNQAWRRAFRLGSTDLGAFERYLKICLGATNYIAKVNQNGTTPSIGIPGSQLMGGILGLDFNMTGSPGSFQSMFPTGDESGIGMLGNIVRPTAGPYVSFIAKGIEQAFAPHSELANKIVIGLIGQVGANSTLLNDVLPSTTLQGFMQIMTNEVFHNNNGTVASVENEIINNMAEQQWRELRKEYVAKVSKDPRWALLSKGDQAMLTRGATDTAYAQWLHDPIAQAKFMEDAHTKAVMMIATKTILNFVSPVALSLNAAFSFQPQLDAIMKEKNADGTPKYTLYEAMDRFATLYPDHVYDLVAHTTSAEGNFPETQSAFSFIEANPELVAKYGYATAMLIQRDSPFSSKAAQLEMRLGLRNRQAPADYMKAINFAAGNDWYYQYAKPQLLQDPRYRAPNGIDLNYNGSKELAAMAKGYGKLNPDWYTEFKGSTKGSIAFDTFTQMESLLKDKSITDAQLPPKNRVIFETLINAYKTEATNINALYQQGYTSQASQAIGRWYDLCNSLAANKEFAPASYFITSVLQKLPTVLVPGA